MRIKDFIKYFLFIMIMLVIFTGCSMNNEDNKDIKAKTTEELTYLEDEVFTIVNKYTKGEYIKDDTLNWEEITKEVQKFNSSLDVLVSDLSEVKVSNDDILAMRNAVNDIIISCGNKDEKLLLQRISYFYSLLPDYLEKYSDNKNKIDIMKLKGLVLSSFVQVDSLNWDEAKNTIGLAESKYKEMMNDIDYMKEYSYNLNKVYILLEEMKNAIELEEVELTKVKYINFIEKIRYLS